MLRLSGTKSPEANLYFRIGQFGLEERTIDARHDVYYYPTVNDRRDAGYFVYTASYSAVGDFNGDGHNDLVLDWSIFPHTAPRTNMPTQQTVYFGDGAGGLRLATAAEVEPFTPIHLGNRIVVADFNGDGIDDIARASEGLNQRDPSTGGFITRYDPLTLMLSAPGGKLVNATANIQGQESGQPATGYGVGHDLSVGDFDGDGDKDLFSGKVLLLNDGKGKFANASDLLSANLKPSHTILTASASADFNKDGKDDLFVAWLDGTQYLALSNWNGQSFGWQEIRLPVGLYGQTNTKPNHAQAADINGDGLPDLIIGQTRSEPYYSGAGIQVLINKGGGQFADESASRIDNSWRDTWWGQGQIDLMDVDADGDVDLIHGTDWTLRTDGASTGGLAVALNDGAGNFHWLPQSIFTDVKPYQLAGFEGLEQYQQRPLQRLFPIDINKDGRIDFVGTVQQPLTAWPQVEPNVYATYTVVGQASLGGPEAALKASFESILRKTPAGADASSLTATAVKVLGGQLTATQALGDIVQVAGSSTSVATLAYQFFTGKIPSLAGVDYLVSPTGPNGNNLNSAYYQSFNLENRYINFAVNLGKIGEGAAKFTAEYGTLSLFEATRKAYAAIFGGTPSDAKVHALIDSRVDYFASYGGDGANGIGTKAAMVGWLLAEAEKADLGVMARSNAAWLTDLADGSAPFAIDILDPAKGYYKADFIFGGG